MCQSQEVVLNAQLPGQFVMSVTPFDSKGEIDEVLLRAQLRRLRDAGLGVYLGSPGTGEGHTLDLPELRRLYEIGVSELKGAVPVFASGNSGANPHSCGDSCANG